jgi:ankyrin repeat protein
MSSSVETVDINERDHFGRTALFRAAERGDSTEVERLLTAGADPAIANVYCISALHIASTVEVVQLLVDHGVDVDALSLNRYSRDLCFVSSNNGTLVKRRFKRSAARVGRCALNIFVSRALASIS